jgi:polyhydroxyalkanoate synthesis regulator phasin
VDTAVGKEDTTMKASQVDKVVEPLVQRGLFETTESAVRGLAQDYILRQIVRYQETIGNLEQKYGMDYDQFIQYLKQRAALLQSTNVSPEQRQPLNQAVMLEEEDALEWKIAREMLQSWLGLKSEVEN